MFKKKAKQSVSVPLTLMPPGPLGPGGKSASLMPPGGCGLFLWALPIEIILRALPLVFYALSILGP